MLNINNFKNSGARIFFVAASLAASVLGQQPSIKGVVMDAGGSGKPVASAVLKLISTKWSDTAGLDGKFFLGASTSLLKPLQFGKANISIRFTPNGLFVVLSEGQTISLAITRATGKAFYKYSGYLHSGSNFMPRPALPNGLFIFSLVTTQGTFSQRFSSLDEIQGFAAIFVKKVGVHEKGLQKLTASNSIVDTLVVTASGYATYRKAVTLGIDTNLTINLAPVIAGDKICGQTPADPLANSKAKNLLCYISSHTFISGQTDIGDAEKVMGMTGRYPAIVAFDFMSYTSGGIQTQKVIDWAKSKKGIVAFQWHWACPNGGNYAANCDFEPSLANPGSKLYKDIDLVVGELKKMGDAGIPVLFRPLHEANNNYMWWAKQKSDAYKKLWVLIYQRAQLAGAHNLLWVFNGMASGQGTSLASWYPGDAYVDIVSSDYFQKASDFEICKAVGTNKTVGIAETMNMIDPAKGPAWPFTVVWASRDWGGNSAQDWKTAMANPKTISIDQLPDMTKW